MNKHDAPTLAEIARMERRETLTYAEIATVYPRQPPPSRRTLLSWSKRGNFPPHFREAKKSEPLFDAQEVAAWIALKFAPMLATTNTGEQLSRKSRA